MKANGFVSHDRAHETPEAKARWFQGLTLSERMDMLCAFTDLAITVNPALQEKKNAQPVAGRIQVLIQSKRAAGRPVDLEDVRLLELSEDIDADPLPPGDADKPRA